MSEKGKALSRAALEAARALPGVSPAVNLLGALGIALGRQDWGEIEHTAMLDGIEYLADLLAAVREKADAEHGALRDTLEAKLDAHETREIALQTVLELGRTASVEKRRRLAHVLANGLADASTPAAELRHFHRAAGALDDDHVAFLRELQNKGGAFDRPVTGLATALIAELAFWRFVAPSHPPQVQLIDNMPWLRDPAPAAVQRVGARFVETADYRMTELGAKFLAFIAAPAE